MKSCFLFLWGRWDCYGQSLGNIFSCDIQERDEKCERDSHWERQMLNNNVLHRGVNYKGE